MQPIYGTIWMTLFLLLFSQPAKGQQSLLINEHFNAVPLIQVLDTLKEKYQLKFSFQHKALEGVLISENIQSQPLGHAMEQLLSDSDLIYKILENRQVLIRKAPNNARRRLIGIRGRVLDGKTKAPLSFASIIYESNKGTETDAEGFFSLDFKLHHLPDLLEVLYLGYEPQKVVLDSTSKLDNLLVYLLPKVEAMEPITVTEQEPMLQQIDQTSGKTTAKVKKLNTLPSFVGGDDPLRNLQYLPGIVATDDLSSELKVRGSNGDENMVILDGIPLFNVSHYFGIFSLINPAVVNKIEVYKNIFPIEYGGRTASVIDIHSGPLQSGKVRGQAEVNLLTSNAYLELPMGNNFGLMLGGRITNKNVADTKLFSLLDQHTRHTALNEETEDTQVDNRLIGLDPNFQFSDFNAKLSWKPGTRTKATFNFFSGSDQFDYSLEQTFDRPVIPDDVFNFQEKANWKNRGASLRVEHQWSDSLKTEITASQSAYQTREELSSTFTFFHPERREFRTIGITQNNQNKVQGIEFRLKNEWIFSGNQSIDFGVQFSDHQTETLLETENHPILEVNNEGYQYSFFAEYRNTIRKRLQFSLGYHPTYFEVTNQVYWSPRLSLAYRLDETGYLKASWSKYYQFLRRSYHENRLGRIYDFWVLPDEIHFPVASSSNLMLGGNWKWQSLEFDIEFYQKDLEGVVEHALVVNGFDQDAGGPSVSRDYRIFKGNGKTLGMDVLLRHSGKHYTGWLAYTLSKSTQWFPIINNGEAFPSPEDRRHQLKWINQYRLKKWTFSITYVFSSGQPFTDLSVLVFQPEYRRFFSPSQRIRYLDNYHRVDLGINYTFPVFGAKGELGFSVFNVLDRQNVKYRQYIYAIRPNPNGNANIRLIGTELQMLGITPNLSFKVAFGD